MGLSWHLRCGTISGLVSILLTGYSCWYASTYTGEDLSVQLYSFATTSAEEATCSGKSFEADISHVTKSLF